MVKVDLGISLVLSGRRDQNLAIFRPDRKLESRASCRNDVKAGNYTFLGLISVAIDPPSGTPVANGTTLECSHWFTYDGSLGYTQSCFANDIAIDLFIEVNPSLSKTSYNKDLIIGNTYYVKLVVVWD